LQSTAETIRSAMFGDRPQVFALVAEVGDRMYSTFLGRPGLWLDDLYVEEPARGGGTGEALLRHLANIAAAAGRGRIEWTVGIENQRAIDFYRRHGAVLREHVRLCRLDRDAITRLAGGR